jgi:hypothetical protein
MPVQKEGRFVTASPDELSALARKRIWKPVHAATETTDLTAELKRGLLYVRHEPQSSQKKKEVERKERSK